MIALAQRLRPGSRGLGHSVLLLIGVAAAIIIGLLAMHSLNSHTETAAHTTAAAAMTHDMGTAEHGDTRPAAEGDCADCGDHTSMLAMACVLALLIVSLLLFLPRVGITWGAALRAGPTMIARATHLPRPPSLLILCISRT